MSSLNLFTYSSLLLYIFCGASFSLLVRRSSQLNDGKYPYEPIAVTFCVGLFKLAFTALYFIYEQSKQGLKPIEALKILKSDIALAKNFLIPSALYFGFDTLSFFNLHLVSASTFRLLINTKVLFSGLILQIVLKQKLTAQKWLGLFLLVMACIIQQSDSFESDDFTIVPIIMICAQAMCSSAAGVYFQLLLQKQNNNPNSLTIRKIEPSLWQKNFYMYCWQCCFNILYLALFNQKVLFHPFAAVQTFDANVIPIILTSGIGGFMTSLILRDLSVIVKEYANFVEMCVVVIGSWWLLKTSITSRLVIAVLLMNLSLFLYNVESNPFSFLIPKSIDLKEKFKKVSQTDTNLPIQNGTSVMNDSDSDDELSNFESNKRKSETDRQIAQVDG